MLVYQRVIDTEPEVFDQLVWGAGKKILVGSEKNPVKNWKVTTVAGDSVCDVENMGISIY